MSASANASTSVTPTPSAPYVNKRMTIVLRLLASGPKKTTRLLDAGKRKHIHPEDINQGIDAGVRAGLITIDPMGRWMLNAVDPA
jgi:hypothetical protein